MIGNDETSSPDKHLTQGWGGRRGEGTLGITGGLKSLNDITGCIVAFVIQAGQTPHLVHKAPVMQATEIEASSHWTKIRTLMDC